MGESLFKRTTLYLDGLCFAVTVGIEATTGGCAGF